MKKPVNLRDILTSISEHWSPQIVGTLNDYEIKVAKIQGELGWHQHSDTDEAFFVLQGEMTIDTREDAQTLRAGELYIVPRGTEHRTRAEQECSILLIEPAGTAKEGD